MFISTLKLSSKFRLCFCMHPERPLQARSFSGYRTRGYKEAINSLNSLQSNANVLAAIQAAGPQPSKQVFDQTNYYLRRLGYKPADLNVLNAIHISGTKGKGSTAAFCSSVLNSVNPSAKVGLFTSPHLLAVRERIRINGKPISEQVFAKYFWELWDKFEDGHEEPLRADLPIRPAYFRFMTYMAYHTFLAECVDATILEVGVGGLLDPTNLIPSPIVTGVTSLGFDHINVLGKSINEIAGHKGGIFKPGVPALTVEQRYPETLNVLRVRARELKSSSFTNVPQRTDLDKLEVGLAGPHQKLNATFAIALVNTFLASPRLPSKFLPQASDIPDDTASAIPSAALPPLSSEPSSRSPEFVKSDDQLLPSLPERLVLPEISNLFRRGLINTKWPGRCQTIIDPVRKRLTWFLDGAHTVESVEACGKWWKQQIGSFESDPSTRKLDPGSSSDHRKILIFNCTFGRNAKDLLTSLVISVAGNNNQTDNHIFDQVIITSNTTYTNGEYKSDLRSVAQDTQSNPDHTIQKEIAEALKSIPKATKKILITDSIQEAVNEVTRQSSESHQTSVLITGSLHLIGGFLDVVGFEEAL